VKVIAAWCAAAWRWRKQKRPTEVSRF